MCVCVCVCVCEWFYSKNLSQAKKLLTFAYVCISNVYFLAEVTLDYIVGYFIILFIFLSIGILTTRLSKKKKDKDENIGKAY